MTQMIRNHDWSLETLYCIFKLNQLSQLKHVVFKLVCRLPFTAKPIITYLYRSINHIVVNYYFRGEKKNHYKEIVTRIRIRIHLGPGSGSTIFKGGSEDPDPDPQFSKGGSEDPDPDPLYQNVDPGIRIRIRIHVKIVWIRNPDCLS